MNLALAATIVLSRTACNAVAAEMRVNELEPL